MVRKFNVPAFTTYCGLGAEQIGPITAISSSCANPFASDPSVPDFNQPKNQVQADFEWRVSTDVEECASGTEKLLMELGVSNLVAPFPASTIQPASTHQVITSPNVHVSAGEDMPSSSRTFRVSSLTEALLDPESGSSYDDSEFSDDDDAEYYVTSAKKEIQQNLSDDEEPQAASVRLMEAEMDVDHEKLLSDNDKQPLPNAKSKQPLAASNQPVTDCEEKNNNEESVDDCDERAEAEGRVLTGKTTQIVLNLLEGLEHKGHCVTMDNFYNSPALARYLKCRGFDCLRFTCKNIPEDVKEMKKNCERARSLLATRRCNGVGMDAKIVSMISTFHDNITYTGTRAGEECEKPICVKDYNTTMGGIDLKDQTLSMYPMERKRGLKWYIKMFKRLLNTCVHNAYILYKDSHNKRYDEKNIMTHREFRYQIAISLKMRYMPPAPVRSLISRSELRLDRTKNHMPIRGDICAARCVY
ncbi:PiggyBac transposable element-derived protein 4 [Eumeta japonica]|uniref:PiggyBac transposable element-derived protein 4 n=1 Tax=Eumeta variegata TaxID=151549 RepID=A0A4C1W5K5_EUMVA|nr:PiggyBac transposable element-derived protein 4 [Eumeta japonica]